jgi:hypothetical protein
MVMQAELVKTQAQAVRRATRYVRDLRNEDDAVQVSVIVPAAYVNAFVQGQRVQYRSSYMPGYKDDFVWLRVASRTVRQTSAASKLYTIAMDLRAEEPPDAGTTGTGSGSGANACTATMATTDFYPLGGSGDTPNPSDGISYYLNPGLGYPIEPEPGHQGHMHFATYGAGGTGTWDMPGSCCQNVVRVMVQGNGTLTIETDPDTNDTVLTAGLWHHQYGAGEEGNLSSGTDVLDELQSGLSGGDTITFDITTHDGQNCTHWVDIRDNGPGQAACGGGWGWKYQGGHWESDD